MDTQPPNRNFSGERYNVSSKEYQGQENEENHIYPAPPTPTAACSLQSLSLGRGAEDGDVQDDGTVKRMVKPRASMPKEAVFWN